MGAMKNMAIEMAEEDREDLFTEPINDYVFRLYHKDRKKFDEFQLTKAYNREQYHFYGKDAGDYVCCRCKTPGHWGKSGRIYNDGVFLCGACNRELSLLRENHELQDF